MKALLRLPSLLFIALIRIYQVTVGRIVPPRCRFHPSCSEYAVEALRQHGLVRGGSAAAWRLIRCGPWTAGGIDPVKARSVAHG